MALDPRLMMRDGRPYTVNLDPGHRVYGEKLHTIDDVEYREWSPYRSKLSAYLTLGGKEIPFRSDSNVLYLGAASGTTASHVSDLVPDGKVYCIEFSPRTFRDLVRTCERRSNMIPILGDATQPESFAFAVGDVDVVYQDVAQKRQAEIFISNMEIFSAKKGMLCIKARSEDVTSNPETVFRNSEKVLKEHGQKIDDRRSLEPFEKDHEMMAVSL